MEPHWFAIQMKWSRRHWPVKQWKCISCYSFGFFFWFFSMFSSTFAHDLFTKCSCVVVFPTQINYIVVNSSFLSYRNITSRCTMLVLDNAISYTNWNVWSWKNFSKWYVWYFHIFCCVGVFFPFLLFLFFSI